MTNSEKPIVWVASYPKSGSTLVRMLLHAYATGTLDINNVRSGTGDKQPYFWQVVAHRDVSTLTPTEVMCLRAAMLCHLVEANPVRPLLVKTHHANAVVDDFPLIPAHLTRAVIYCVRDPRDVALSYAAHFGCSVDDAIERMGRDSHQIGEDDNPIKHYLSSWSHHVKSWTDDTLFPVFLVRYEEAVNRPADIVSKLIERLGQEPDAKRAERAAELCDFTRLQRQEAESGQGFVENPRKDSPFFRKGIAGQWQTELTVQQIKKIETDHSPMMGKLGYLSTRMAA